MQRINILPIHIANQIAAGEVVERPASVIKELLENSIDAGATAIEIQLDKGGIQRMMVRDNGNGIHQDDLPLALARHATSKIKDVNDLYHLSSLGFRGEALASIASVSEFSLTSHEKTAEMAWQIRLRGESLEPVIMPAAHPIGTTVEVCNLFYNTPARRKFLKAERTEFTHIEDMVRALALSSFTISIHLQNNERSIIRVNAAESEFDIKQRIAKLLGKIFVQEATYFSVERLGLKLMGWVLPAVLSRAHADIQYFFVNGRIVKDKLLRHAVNTVFTDEISAGRYPGYLLYLECDPTQLDVNVHPTKHEVRFSDSRIVHDFIVFAIREQLQLVRSSSENTMQYSVKPLYVATETSSFAIAQPQNRYDVTIQSAIDYRMQGSIAGEFILVELAHTLLVVDYKKAYRYLTQQYFLSDTMIAQPLLIPESLSLSSAAIESLLEKHTALTHYGIDFRQASPDSIIVKKLPTILKGCALANLMKALSSSVDAETLQGVLLDFIVFPALTNEQANQVVARVLKNDLATLFKENVIHQFSIEQLKRLFS